MDVEKQLVELMTIDSTTGNELNICNYVYSLLKKSGFKVKKVLVDKNGFNVVAKIGVPKVYLQAHLDSRHFCQGIPFLHYTNRCSQEFR